MSSETVLSRLICCRRQCARLYITASISDTGNSLPTDHKPAHKPDLGQATASSIKRKSRGSTCLPGSLKPWEHLRITLGPFQLTGLRSMKRKLADKAPSQPAQSSESQDTQLASVRSPWFSETLVGPWDEFTSIPTDRLALCEEKSLILCPVSARSRLWPKSVKVWPK